MIFMFKEGEESDFWMKYLIGLVILFVLVGCTAAPKEPVETEQPSDEVEAPLEGKIAEENGALDAETDDASVTDENLEFSDDVRVFEEMIGQMAQWQSYKTSVDQYETFFDKEQNIDSEFHETFEFIREPFQLFKSTHSIRFQNDRMDRYIVANAETGELEGVERFSLEEWQTVEDPQYYSKTIIPARAEMLQAMIDFSEERVVSEDGQSLTLNVQLEKSKEAYNKMVLSLFYNVTDEELTEDLQEQIAMGETGVERIAVFIYSNGTNITGYDGIIYTNFINDQQYDKITIEERFSEMNTLTSTTTPEDL